MGVYGRCDPCSHERTPGMALVPAGKRPPLRAPGWRSSRASAPHRKTSPAAQRTGGHRRVATRKTTGDPAAHRGAGDPETADGGIRMRRPEKRGPSRRALSRSTMLRVREAESGYLWPSRVGGLRSSFTASFFVDGCLTASPTDCCRRGSPGHRDAFSFLVSDPEGCES